MGIAIVGLGVGEAHARAYAHAPGCRLASLYDLDRAKAEKAARSLGRPRVAASYDEILRDPQVRVVSIASYDDAHFGQAEAALKAGKHVFVEKPLCRSLAEARALLRAWELGGKSHLASNLVLRAAPLYRWLKVAVAEGLLGEVYAVDGDYLYGRLHKITDGWRLSVKDYSVMQGGGIHMVDLMMWLTGRRPISVTAAGNRIASRGTAFRYKDYAAAVFSFDDGMVGRITANFGCVHRHQHRLAVFGTKATFLYDDAGARLHTSRDPGSRVRRLEASPLPATKGDLIADFVKGILERRDPEPDLRRELDVVCACSAADEAMEEKGLRIRYP
ncbi:MAG: Gfo/Idh/MocA family oxidoreductase [Elusimicrobia bacterium]|nr:Gfo/Idh/MocA family oxidoreductase [Elusimicrobiota bacterium]